MYSKFSREIRLTRPSWTSRSGVDGNELRDQRLPRVSFLHFSVFCFMVKKVKVYWCPNGNHSFLIKYAIVGRVSQCCEVREFKNKGYST